MRHSKAPLSPRGESNAPKCQNDMSVSLHWTSRLSRHDGVDHGEQRWLINTPTPQWGFCSYGISAEFVCWTNGESNVLFFLSRQFDGNTWIFCWKSPHYFCWSYTLFCAITYELTSIRKEIFIRTNFTVFNPGTGCGKNVFNLNSEHCTQRGEKQCQPSGHIILKPGVCSGADQLSLTSSRAYKGQRLCHIDGDLIWNII